MKNLKCLLALLLLSITLGYAQVGVGTTTPNASSMLDIESTNSGILIPRMTEIQKNAIASPATGLLIYQIDATAGFWYFDGAIWTTFGGADNDWTVSGTEMYNANTGNVGVGNTAPTTKFHVTGTTTPGGGGGTTTIYSNDFSSGSLNNTLNAGNTCTTSPNIWHVYNVDTWQGSCSTCTDERAYIEYSGSCDQNQTVTEGVFTPTATSINVSFNYGYNDFSAGDSFVVTLYNETTSTTSATILNLTADATNTSYSGSHIVVAGNNYSLKFQYIGSDDVGAAFDDILVTETAVASSGTYVFRLEDGQQQDGYVLTSDANGNATWEAASGGGGGGGGTYTFTNGLTEASGTVKLGGSLIEDTTITLGTNDLTLDANSTGYFEIEGNNRRIVQTNAPDDYISFGGGSTIILGNDGTTFRDTDNNLFTIDFVAGFYAGDSGGSAIEVGSIEYILDGHSELFVSNSFSPFTDGLLDLGADATINTNDRYWQDVYADNFVATGGTTYNKISGKSGNKMKGLSEIMKLNPFIYKQESVNIGSRMSTTQEDDIAIGFNAKELLAVIPEAVKTSDWYTEVEGEDMVKKEIKDPQGIIYNRIIPVTVKAIQEQQEEIEILKSTVEELKKQLQILTEK